MVLSVNDKWHYCQNSDILVGSRAMRDRHLRLLGYCLVQVRGAAPTSSGPGDTVGGELGAAIPLEGPGIPTVNTPVPVRGSRADSSSCLLALPHPIQDFFHAAGG